MKDPAKSLDNSLSKKKAWWKMVTATVILGTLAYIFSRYPSQLGEGWYHQLQQPFFAPPYWLPFVMWSIVYILMGCSIGIIWHYAAKSPSPKTVNRAKKGIVLFGIHLLFNLIFPVILIGFHLPIIAFLDILLLIIFIIVLIWHFNPINRSAAYLLLPYLIWIIYASALNLAIIILN